MWSGGSLPSPCSRWTESEAKLAASVSSVYLCELAGPALVLLPRSRLSSGGSEHRVRVQACEGVGPEPCGFRAGHFPGQPPWHCDLAEDGKLSLSTEIQQLCGKHPSAPALLCNGRGSGPTVSLLGLAPLAGQHLSPYSLHLNVKCHFTSIVSCRDLFLGSRCHAEQVMVSLLASA